jgi:hypothetical protein
LKGYPHKPFKQFKNTFMKSLETIIIRCKNIFALLMLCFIQTTVWAQDKSADVNVKITKDNGNWYAQPWVWIVGGAVFLLLLVALLRGNGNKD